MNNDCRKTRVEEIHPVDRYGFDPVPFNKGEYIYIEGEGYVPGRYTYKFDIDAGIFVRTGAIRK